jgi:hypothetical protein
MKRFLLMLLSAVAIGLLGCETPRKEKETVRTVTTTSTTTSTKPMAFGALAINQTEGTVSFDVPANTIYTVEWHVNSNWSQRILVTSSRTGILEKHTVESSIKAAKWHHQHKTRAFPETITVLMEHKDDAGNWFPSAIQTRDLPTDGAVRFAIDSENHPHGGTDTWDDSQLIFSW